MHKTLSTKRLATAVAVAAAVVVPAMTLTAGSAAAAPVTSRSATAAEPTANLFDRNGFFPAKAPVYRVPVDGLRCVLLFELCRQSEARAPGDEPPLFISRSGEKVTIQCRLGKYLQIRKDEQPRAGAQLWALERDIVRTSVLGPVPCGTLDIPRGYRLQ